MFYPVRQYLRKLIITYGEYVRQEKGTVELDSRAGGAILLVLWDIRWPYDDITTCREEDNHWTFRPCCNKHLPAASRVGCEVQTFGQHISACLLVMILARKPLLQLQLLWGRNRKWYSLCNIPLVLPVDCHFSQGVTLNPVFLEEISNNATDFTFYTHISTVRTENPQIVVEYLNIWKMDFNFLLSLWDIGTM